MKTRNNKEKGAMIVLVALAMPVLLGGIGLVMDNGVMYNLKRRAQAAADAQMPLEQRPLSSACIRPQGTNAMERRTQNRGESSRRNQMASACLRL